MRCRMSPGRFFLGEDFDANQRRLFQDEIFRLRAGHDADIGNAESSR